MNIQVIGFIPPMLGLENDFNTFRIGGALAKRVAIDQEVFLMNEKTKVIFGRAQVTRIEVGNLDEMCQQYGFQNHRELNSDKKGAALRLLTYIQKIYGPHIATLEKKSCVVWLKRIE